MISDLRSDQWKAISEYSDANIDKGVDYDFVVLKKQGVKLKFEWDNWFEGSVVGPDVLLQGIQEKYQLK